MRSYNFVLNDAQRKLVEDNHNLIYSYLNKKHFSIDSIHDFYGDCAIGLCIAAYIFKPELGYKFSTLAYKTMGTEISHTIQKIDKTIDYVLFDTIGDDDNINVLYNIEDNNDYIGLSELKQVIRYYYDKLSDRDKSIVKLSLFKDYTYTEIGKMFGITKQAVSLIILKFKNNIYNATKNS